MLKTWHTLKGYIAGVVAFIFCPCHLPLTLPLLIALTAGTAFSAWLAAPRNTLLVGAISTVIFVGGLALAFKWMNATNSPLPEPIRETGTPTVTLLTSAGCRGACEAVKSVWQAAQAEVDFKLEEVDIASPRGRDLAARHNVFTTPAVIVNGERHVPGAQSLERALETLRTATAAK